MLRLLILLKLVCGLGLSVELVIGPPLWQWEFSCVGWECKASVASYALFMVTSNFHEITSYCGVKKLMEGPIWCVLAHPHFSLCEHARLHYVLVVLAFHSVTKEIVTLRGSWTFTYVYTSLSMIWAKLFRDCRSNRALTSIQCYLGEVIPHSYLMFSSCRFYLLWIFCALRKLG